MIDIHAPHETAHTWTDFFIHIATIVVGLCIAVGLEQTVEALHRENQREELIHDFRNELTHNLSVIDDNQTRLATARAWEKASLTALTQAQPAAGFVTVTLPQRAGNWAVFSTSGAVWTIAKSSGKAGLLPEALAETYDRSDHEVNEFIRGAEAQNESNRKLTAVTAAAGFPLNARAPGAAVTLHLSVAQRDAISAAFADELGQSDNCIQWNAYVRAASEAVLDGVASRDAMVPYFQRARLRYTPND
jgi:hypothetical protein